MNQIHFIHWHPSDYRALDTAKSFSDLSKLALGMTDRISGKIEMVSGPISTGGVGSAEGNKRVFEGIIEILISESASNIFSQMPFETKMEELYRKWYAENPGEKYCWPILDEFYEPLFASGKVERLHFIHDWESSTGATWEHDNCDRWGIKRHYLPKELSIRALDGSVIKK
jgi:hypothetical protein